MPAENNNGTRTLMIGNSANREIHPHQLDSFAQWYKRDGDDALLSCYPHFLLSSNVIVCGSTWKAWRRVWVKLLFPIIYFTPDSCWQVASICSQFCLSYLLIHLTPRQQVQHQLKTSTVSDINLFLHLILLTRNKQTNYVLTTWTSWE